VVDEASGKALADEAGGRRSDAAPGVAMRLIHRNGTACSIRDSFSPIRDRAGSDVGMVVVFHDVSQIQEMAQRLTWQASHDPLTGLANRREFERRMADLIELSRTQGKQHALLYMDLDNFKTVNDTCGHAAGDELLRQLTTVMSSKVRGSDTLARVGGDEFGVLLDSCPPDQALRIANAIREAVRDFRFVWQDRTFGIGVSMGLVPLDKESGDVSRVLAVADTFCYEAKSKGRDRVQVYRPAEDPGDLARTDLRVLSQINSAFELDRFRLFRQRISDLKSTDDRAARYEVLVRMLDRNGNLVPPTGFMPAAERYNLLTSIERWVVTTLVEHLQRQCELGLLPSGPAVLPDTFYAVNLSAASITDSSFPDFVRKLLTRYSLPRGLLAFEVTETAAISNLTKAAGLMHELKAMGCRFALDDFGIGMSSFAYLKYLPVDYLKIDGVFVRDMANDPMDFAIVEAINRIGHILGLKTVAEYVEDAVTLDRLKWLGVDYAQGYFVAEPEALIPSAEPQRVTA
jgi:diguanylate cyclase (GGDEF)-like protein